MIGFYQFTDEFHCTINHIRGQWSAKYEQLDNLCLVMVCRRNVERVLECTHHLQVSVKYEMII